MAGGGLRLTSASDRLAIGVLVAFSLLAAGSRSWSVRTLVPVVGGVLVILLVARWGRRSRLGRVVHDLSPAVWTPCIFNVAGPLIERVNPTRWDRELAALDVRIFGRLPDAWHGALGRPAWLTDIASLAYVSFYVLPIALAVSLYVRGREREYERFVFTVQVAFFVSYLGYFAFPASGPRVAVEREADVLGGGATSVAVRAFLHVVEINVLDAFPSGHTAVSLVVLVLGWRIFRRWRAAIVVLVLAILFSTVYLSLHYVVDLAAGALVAALVPIVLPPIARACAMGLGCSSVSAALTSSAGPRRG
jgi:membrane-associated phospholipid phosphatase